MAHPLQAFFSTIKLFSTLNADELNEILRGIQPVQLKAGDRLFGQGDPGDAAYVIQAGRVQIFTTAEGREIEIAVLEAGAVLGELALLDGAPRSASARAADDCSLFRLDKSEFDFLRRNLRPAAYQLIRAMTVTICDRIRDTNLDVAALMREDAPAVEEALPPTRSGFFKRLFRRD